MFVLHDSDNTDSVKNVVCFSLDPLPYFTRDFRQKSKITLKVIVLRRIFVFCVITNTCRIVTLKWFWGSGDVLKAIEVLDPFIFINETPPYSEEHIIYSSPYVGYRNFMLSRIHSIILPNACSQRVLCTIIKTEIIKKLLEAY